MSGKFITLDRAKLEGAKARTRREFTRKIEVSKQATLDHVREVASWAAGELADRTFPSRVGIIYAIKAMQADVAAVYATPGRVYEKLMANPFNAKAFWSAIKDGDLNKATLIVRTSGTDISGIIIGAPLDPNLHDQARNDIDGRVALKAPLQMVTQSELESYTKLAIKRLGKTASGWYAASDDLGGNGGGNGWKGIGIHGKDGGHARVSITETEVSVTLINKRPLAAKHISPSQVKVIMREAKKRLMESIKTAFKKSA